VAVERHSVTYRGSTPEAPGVASFTFSRPEGYAFDPGQFLSLTIETRDGTQTKHFTICSAPGDSGLAITTRLSGSAFKDALLALEPGQQVTVTDPRGAMTLRPGDAKVAFLVGGIGVTPARCIIRDAVQRGGGPTFLVFYGNLDQDSIPFKTEFDAYERDHPEISVVHVLAEPKPGWRGETGFITADVVRRHTDPMDGWHWVVAGPPAMIDAMKRVLADLEVPAERASFEVFAGYE
jgi:glycine betaine catabolism B